MRNNLAKSFVIITTSFSSVWMVQACFNLYIYYLIPLSLSCLVLFFKKKQIRYFSFFVSISIASIIGNVPYFAAINLLVALTFSIPYLLTFKIKKIIKIETNDFISACLTIVMIFIYLALAYSSVHGLISVAEGRNGFLVPFNDFLNYARGPWFRPFLGWMSGDLFYGDNLYYMGLAPWGIIFYYLIFGLRYRMPTAMVGTITASLFLIGLSFGGIIASALYLLPGMQVYRHISLVYGVISLLLSICAGFMLDTMEAPTFDIESILKKRFLLSTAILLLALDLIYTAIKYRHAYLTPVGGRIHWEDFLIRLIVLGILSAGFFIFHKLKRCSWDFEKLGFLILFFIIFDMVFFQLSFFKKYLPKPSINNVYLNDLIMKDSSIIPIIRKEHISQLESMFPKYLKKRYSSKFMNARYRTEMPFLGDNACEMVGRGELWSKYVYKLFQLRGVTIGPWEINQYGPTLKWELSCGKNIFKFITDKSVLKMAPNNGINKLLSDAKPKEIIIPNDKNHKGLHNIRFNSLPLDQQQNTKFKILTYSGDKLVLKYHSHKNGLLFISDAYDPRWKGFIDNKKTKVIQANIGFKAVRTPSGTHTVMLMFSPTIRILANIIPYLDIFCLVFVIVQISCGCLLSPCKSISELL